MPPPASPHLQVAKKGDWVRIDVTSTLLSTLISVHWHGVNQVMSQNHALTLLPAFSHLTHTPLALPCPACLQMGTPWSDGTPGIASVSGRGRWGGGGEPLPYQHGINRQHL